MDKVALDIYDDMPKAMKRYISNYGWHFNKAAYEYAVSVMKDKNGNRVTPFTKEKLDTILGNYGVNIDKTTLYDYVYIATLGKALYSNSTFKDERALVSFIKDSIDNPNLSKNIFRMWSAFMVGSGNPIEWNDIC